MATAAAPAAAPAPAAPAALVPRGQVDLVDFIDWRHVECLNQDSSHTVINALKQGYRDDEGLYLASDSGEQLLIHIPFTQVVKLHSSLFKGPEEEGPKIIKLFTNKEHMGFSNVGDYPPSDSLNLSSNHLVGNKLVHLKYVKFQNVCSLIIFIEHNQSKSDVSKIQKIVLFGSIVKIVKDPVPFEVGVYEYPEGLDEGNVMEYAQEEEVETPIRLVYLAV